MNNIQKATLEQLDELIELFDAYRMFYNQQSNKAEAGIFLRERITKQESVIFIAYSSSHQSVGFVQLYPIFSSTRMKKLWLLNDLFVDPRYRGQGFSKQLIERSKQLCHETNACGLILETAKSNDIGNQLYPRAGFALDQEHNYYSWDK